MGFLEIAMAVSLALLVWDCVEVGRNDAANLVLRRWIGRRSDRHEQIYHEEFSRRLRGTTATAADPD